MSEIAINEYLRELEYALDQRPPPPVYPTIAKLFNTYRFADHKDKVIDLLKRICTVSVRTMEIVGEMETISTLENKGRINR
jgi:hypothetical protein